MPTKFALCGQRRGKEAEAMLMESEVFCRSEGNARTINRTKEIVIKGISTVAQFTSTLWIRK